MRKTSERLRRVLADAWQIRDRLESPADAADGWSPVELRLRPGASSMQLLLDIDLRGRAGRAFDAMQLPSGRGAARTFADPRSTWHSWTSAHCGSAGRGSAAGCRTPVRSLRRATTFAGDPELEQVGKAVRTYYRLSMRLPDYLRWSAETNWRWPSYQRLDELEQQIAALAATLQRFDQELTARQGERLAGPAADDPLLVTARGLEQAHAAIEAVVQDQVDFLVTHSDQPAHRHWIDGLLRTTVPTAAQRARMVTSLVAAQPAQGAALAPVAVFPQQRSTPAARWQTVARNCGWRPAC